MKKSVILGSIFWMSMAICAPQAMAQKQGRVEKLLKLLNENEQEKFEKGREKLKEDAETSKAFANELGLIDAMNELWNKKNSKAVATYFDFYGKANKAAFPVICQKEKINPATLTDKTAKMLFGYLEESADKLNFSKLIIDNINQQSYPIDQTLMQKILDIRETALSEDMEKNPALLTCDTYFKEFPNGKYKQQMRTAQNAKLYQNVKKEPTDANFKAFFDNKDLQEFFKDKGSRNYLTEVRSIYDNFLYELIKVVSEKGTPEEIKKQIDNYKNSVYLTATDRKHLKDIEYLNDKVDFELLQPQVTSVSKLGLIKEYLTTHKYKEFRDKANDLRKAFEEQVIESSPTSMKFYSKGLITKENQTLPDKTVSITYTYNDKNMPGSILTITQEKGKGSQEVQTNFFYDAQDRCALELQTNPKTKKEIYKRTRTFSPEGRILTDTLKHSDGRMILSSYNPNGQLVESKEYGKSNEVLAVTTYKYNDKGWKIESQYSNMSGTVAPDQILSQKDDYEYDEYGYLSKLSFQKILGNNEKMTGNLIYLYDEYGNVIDSNSYYEYDDAGRWIRRTNRNNPEEVERVQCIYN